MSLVAEPCRPVVERRWASLRGISLTLLAGYFLVSWTESFPSTAYLQLMTSGDLAIPLDMQARFYAVVGLPWGWKPVYGLLSDSFPIAGLHRTPYIALTAVGSAAAYIATAVWVHSMPALYAITACRCFCNAFGQLMLGALLVDAARKDVWNSAALQALANSAKQAGTLAAQSAALLLYTPGSQDRTLEPRPVLAVTAFAPLLLGLLAPALREERRDQPAEGCRRLCLSRQSAVIAMAIALVQLNLLVVGVQGLMDGGTWRHLVIGVGSGSCAFLALLAWLSLREPRQTGGAEPWLGDGAREGEDGQGPQEGAGTCGWLRVGLFALVASALPRSSLAVNRVVFSVFTLQSQQAVQLIGPVASLCGCLVFGTLFHRRDVRWVIVRSTAATMASGLVQLPFVLASRDAGSGHQLWSGLGALCVLSSVAGGFATIFGVLPVDTLITSVSGLAAERSALAYAVLLSLYSLGGSIGDLAGAPVCDALGLTGQDWGALPVWVLLTSALQALLFPLLWILPNPPRDGRGRDAFELSGSVLA